MSNEQTPNETNSQSDPSPESKRPLFPPLPKTNQPDDDENTLSLFDLMEERDETPGAQDKPTKISAAVQPATSDDEDTADLDPITPPLADLPTPPSSRPSDFATTRKRPLQSDPDATKVRPTLAFRSGNTEERPLPRAEQPTQIHQRATPPPTNQPVRQPTPPPPAPLKIAMPSPERQTPPAPVPARQVRQNRNRRGCVNRALIALLIGGVLLFSLTTVGLALGYRAIANDLPSPTELENRVSTFETARILDRNGNLLFATADPNAGNRTRVSLNQISPDLLDATIAIEDARFYENPGFDPIGITRAIYQAAREREFVSGASTITQQLVRATLLDEDERTQRTFTRKVREIILAAEISRTYDKDVILELYLNEIYYGNLAYGIEAAAQTYFDKPAAELTLAEASLLAGLPQAPAAWDPYKAPDLALARQGQVLQQMAAEGYISIEQAQQTLNETNLFIYNLEPPTVSIEQPHFTFTVLQQAEELLGAQSIYRGGLRIFTTLDPIAQDIATDVIEIARPTINAGGANNAALIAIEPTTGEVLAMVGSVDFNDETISGQVNMTLQPRQPGSSIKPFVYLAAMEQGWTPSTLIWDVPTQFPNGTNPPYEPKNFDDEFHGPLRLRPALGNSYNIPAVKALEFVGVCPFIERAQQYGLRSLQDEGCVEVGQPRNVGLALSLGGGEIPPIEMAAAYATLANQGNQVVPLTIRRIENAQGNVLFERTEPEQLPNPITPEHAFLISDILSDNNARQPEFGINNALVIDGYDVAAKTGTSGTDATDVRDAWTVGYTPQIATAVWVGNTDNEPLGDNQSGTRLASPIWRSFMSQYLATKQPVEFAQPASVEPLEICALSGTEPSDACDQRTVEFFAPNQPPLPADSDFLQRVPIDLWTGLVANENCDEAIFRAGFFDLLVSGQENVREREERLAQEWLEQSEAGRRFAEAQGIALPLQLPPDEACDENTPRPEVAILAPQPNAEVIDTVLVQGIARGPNVQGYQLAFGLGQNPGGFRIITAEGRQVDNGRLAEWDTRDIDNSGALTLQLLLIGPDNPFTEVEDPVTLELFHPLTLLEPTATPTPTNTPTPLPTDTPTATPTITPTAIPTRAPTTPTPTNTPTPEPAEPTPTEELGIITPEVTSTPDE